MCSQLLSSQYSLTGVSISSWNLEGKGVWLEENPPNKQSPSYNFIQGEIGEKELTWDGRSLSLEIQPAPFVFYSNKKTLPTTQSWSIQVLKSFLRETNEKVSCVEYVLQQSAVINFGCQYIITSSHWFGWNHIIPYFHWFRGVLKKGPFL